MDKKWFTKVIAQNEDACRIKILENDNLLSFQEVFEYWQTSSDFTQFYVKTLLDLDFEGYFWEHPALKNDFLSKPYECVMLNTRSFAKKNVDETAFGKYLDSDNEVEVFDNLGKNAKLVVPTQKTNIEYYKHLGIFLQNAPKEQIRMLFKKIGEHILTELDSPQTIWLNMAGLGVIWLHVRLDTRPKYYKTKTYKNAHFLE